MQIALAVAKDSFVVAIVSGIIFRLKADHEELEIGQLAAEAIDLPLDDGSDTPSSVEDGVLQCAVPLILAILSCKFIKAQWEYRGILSQRREGFEQTRFVESRLQTWRSARCLAG
jgi:hypothetical protein